jgi:hypothetical protein
VIYFSENMVKYTLRLKIKDADEEHDYELNLGVAERDNPATIFTMQKRQDMRRVLEQKSECKVSDRHLDQIVVNWLLDIQEDYRETYMVLELPSLLLGNISNLQEQGCQTIPEMLPPNIKDIEPTFGMMPPLNFC